MGKKTHDVDPGFIEENLAEMSGAIAKVHDAELIEEFLYSLFTKAETDEMAKRWALVKRLAEGATQRSIASELHLSLCKITRGSRELKREGSPFRAMLEAAGYKPEPGRGKPGRP